MTKRRLVTSLLATLPIFASAKDTDGKLDAPILKDGAILAAKAHMRGFLKSDFEKMAKTYAPKVTLVAGHEMLKAEHGLAGAGGRDAAITVGSAELLAAMEKAFDGPLMPADQIEKFFEVITFTSLETKVGDHAIDPPDPVATPDGKAHFAIVDGDVLIKAGPEKGDFILLQLRQMEGGWRVVAELLD